MVQQLDLNGKIDQLIEKVTILEKNMATKDDLRDLATKKDLARLKEQMATKQDLTRLGAATIKGLSRLEEKIDGVLEVQEKIVEVVEERLKRVEDKLNLPAIS